MGFFGSFVYSAGRWGDQPAGDEYLSIDVHDSDIATVGYAPAGGLFYLGFEPRDYFDDPDASVPVDADAEALAFSDWARRVHGVDVPAAKVRDLMANPDSEPEDAFVEETVARLLALVSLPVPAGLPAP